MGNIINIAKYTFKSLRIMYIVEGIIVAFLFFTGSISSRFTGGVEGIGTIAVFTTINVIGHLIAFKMMLSKEFGRLMFMTPIKSSEYFAGNLLSFVIPEIILLFTTCIWPAFSSISSLKLVALVGSIIIMVFIIGYIVTSSLMVICGSYIRSGILAMVVTIVAITFGGSVYKLITSIVLGFLPYVYVLFNGSFPIQIDIVATLVDIIVIAFIQYFAIRRLENNYDIV